MKSVSVYDSVGMVLCQDITKIVPGEFKGALFKKGHVITKEDIPQLLSVGKEHIYVWETNSDDVHENDAALAIAEAICGENVLYDKEPTEGKSGLYAASRGLLCVDKKQLLRLNMIEFVTVATLPNYYIVEKGDKLGGARVVPLVVSKSVIDEVQAKCQERPALTVLPYQKLKCGVVTTGGEVYSGLIQDKFGPVMKAKVDFYGGEYLGQTLCPDNQQMITQAILDFKNKGADLVIMTGGMSVDPDDLTPAAIKATGAKVITYGAPVQPGNMFMLAYLKNTVLVGVPGCAMFFHTTALDAVLPRIFVGQKLKKSDFAAMGAGGFCRSCENCSYPKCYFCRG